MVRAARTGDAGELGRVHVAAWQRAYRGVFPDDFLDGLDPEARADWFRRAIDAGSGILVAEEGGRVAGFCIVGASDIEGWAEVFAIYVDPVLWGRGHGAALLRGAERLLAGSGHERVLLWVVDSNRGARAFYENMGWTLGRPVRLEEIGGVQVTLVRYEKLLQEPYVPA
ncbi:MAG: GNAT family N-acetyltransferase [Acidimicrobiia bacterium]